MSERAVRPRALAHQDATAALDTDLSDSEQAAMGFVAALEAAYPHIGRFPGAGSLRHAHELNLPGLRAWKLKRCPYLVFYIHHDDHIDVWRVLHSSRDIAAWLRDPDDG